MRRCRCPHAQQSYTAGAFRFAVRLRPERTRIVPGEPVWLSFDVENRSRRDLRIVIGNELQIAENRARFRLSARRNDGKILTPPPPPRNWAGNYMSGPHDLLAGKSHTFYILLQTVLPVEQPGTYMLTCRKRLQILKSPPGSVWHPDEKPIEIDTAATATLTVLPADPRALAGNDGDTSRDVRRFERAR